MDNAQARLILGSFRPDGADVHDPDFAEALAHALQNRELGEWLAHERAFDAGFANALAAIQLPPSLRADIDACLAGEVAESTIVVDSNDTLFIQALTKFEPPAGLRDHVLAAMDLSAAVAKTPANPWQRYAFPLAAAAGIALAFFLTHGGKPRTSAFREPLRSEIVQTSFINRYESQGLKLDHKNPDHQTLIQNLRDSGLPCPCSLPSGLVTAPSIGCKELVINGMRGSVICFNETENGVVHLVIFRREDIEGVFPQRSAAQPSQAGRWTSAQWQEGDQVYILLGNSDPSKLARLL
jgi:hypothetical protein